MKKQIIVVGEAVAATAAAIVTQGVRVTMNGMPATGRKIDGSV